MVGNSKNIIKYNFVILELIGQPYFDLKTLFNIVEERMKKCLTLMSVLYNDVQKGQETARNAKVLKLMQSLSRNL